MPHIDIFNGDADGICALTQLRNAEPTESRLVTGVKRDIALVAKADIGEGDQVTILDISLDRNRDALVQALEVASDVLYVDHHFAGEIPSSPKLTAVIETAPDVCTSLLVNGRLNGAFAGWAVVGAYGDNLDASAKNLARSLDWSDAQCERAADLGRYMNYNGYGAAVEDLHFAPATLFEKVRPFASPFDFLAEDGETFARLERGYGDDMRAAQETKPTHAGERTAVFTLPAEKWARRVSGVFGNQLAKDHPGRAHAILTDRGDGTFVVSVRAPLENKAGADELCREFPTGGGRAAAAGINELPDASVDAFVTRFAEFYGA